MTDFYFTWIVIKQDLLNKGSILDKGRYGLIKTPPRPGYKDLQESQYCNPPLAYWYNPSVAYCNAVTFSWAKFIHLLDIWLLWNLHCSWGFSICRFVDQTFTLIFPHELFTKKKLFAISFNDQKKKLQIVCDAHLHLRYFSITAFFLKIKNLKKTEAHFKNSTICFIWIINVIITYWLLSILSIPGYVIWCIIHSSMKICTFLFFAKKWIELNEMTFYAILRFRYTSFRSPKFT